MAFSGPDMCTTCCNQENKSFLLKFPFPQKGNFLDLVCSVHAVTITIGFIDNKVVSLNNGMFLTLYVQYMLKPRE